MLVQSTKYNRISHSTLELTEPSAFSTNLILAAIYSEPAAYLHKN